MSSELEARLRALEEALGLKAGVSIAGRPAAAPVNPRAMTMDLKDVELMVVDHEDRIAALESAKPKPSTTSGKAASASQST